MTVAHFMNPGEAVCELTKRNRTRVILDLLTLRRLVSRVSLRHANRQVVPSRKLLLMYCVSGSPINSCPLPAREQLEVQSRRSEPFC